MVIKPLIKLANVHGLEFVKILKLGKGKMVKRQLNVKINKTKPMVTFFMQLSTQNYSKEESLESLKLLAKKPLACKCI